MIRRALLAAAAAALVPAAAVGHPLTIHDLITAVRVSEPQLSPDGRLVLFARTTTDEASGQRNSDIYVVPADGSSAPRLLIGGAKTENTPRWSPDGRTIAFISTRAGAPQVFLADADGSNVRQLTHLSDGAQPPLVFSPKGDALAFVSDVAMGTPAPDGVAVHQLTRLLYRHWNEWRDNRRHHVFVAKLSGGAAIDVTPGDFDSPPTQQEDAALSFSADGSTVFFVSNREGNNREAFTTNNDVWSVPATGGEARRITTNPAADVQPVPTKDGRSLVIRTQRRAGFESDRWYLDVIDLATGRSRTVFTTPDLSVTNFSLSPDGQTIFFTATSNAHDNLYRVPLAGGTPQEVVHGGAVAEISVGQNTVAFTESTMLMPSEIFRSALAPGATPARLTHENDAWLKDVTYEKPESMTVGGGGGTPVQYWILKPPGFDPSRKYPVVFMLHGGPQGSWDDAWSYRWNPALWAAQGWVIAAPNPRGSFGFGQSFVDQISGDWCGAVMQDFQAVFDAVTRLPYVDASRQGVAGASYGGYAVDWLITHPNHFKAAVTHDGVFNLHSMALATEEEWFTDWEFGGPPTSAAARQHFEQCSPSNFADNLKTTAPPTLVITNEQDFRVPLDQGLQLFSALKRAGVPSEGLVFEHEGHFVLTAKDSEYWHQRVFGWLTKYLGE